MIFKDAMPTNENYYERYESTGGKWEFGLVKMGFGIRVRAGIVGSGFVSIDAEAGTNPISIVTLLLGVKIFLEAFPEDIEENIVHVCFPVQHKRPFELDPDFVAWVEEIIEKGYVYDCNDIHPMRLHYFPTFDIV